MSRRFDSEYGDDSQEYFGDDDFHDYDEDTRQFQVDDDERDIDFDDFIDQFE